MHVPSAAILVTQPFQVVIHEELAIFINERLGLPPHLFRYVHGEA